MNRADGSPEFACSTEKRAEPVVALSLDGKAETAALTFNLGLTETRSAWDPKRVGARNADLHFVLGGLTARTTLDDKSDDFVVTGLGLGEVTTRVDVRDTTVFRLDLNPADMRRFDVHGVIAPSGQPRFEIVPRFDLALAYKFADVAGDYGTPPPSYFLDETYRIVLESPARKPVFETVAETVANGFGGGLRMVAGSLTVSSGKAPSPVVVPQGKCLTSTEMAPMGSHPVLGRSPWWTARRALPRAREAARHSCDFAARPQFQFVVLRHALAGRGCVRSPRTQAACGA